MSKYKLIGELNINPDSLPKSWYSRSYNVSTAGGQGKVWEVKESKTCIEYTISTSIINTVNSKHNRFTFRFKRHYVLTEEGYNSIIGMLVEKSM
jgi:hypothetical protein